MITFTSGYCLLFTGWPADLADHRDVIFRGSDKVYLDRKEWPPPPSAQPLVDQWSILPGLLVAMPSWLLPSGPHPCETWGTLHAALVAFCLC